MTVKVITALTSDGGQALKELAAQQDSTESQIIRRSLSTYEFLLGRLNEGAKISIVPLDDEPFFLSIPRVTTDAQC